MTNAQLYLVMGVPMLFNGLLFGFFWVHFNARLDSIENHFNIRFDDMKDMWRAELKRVEEVFDARLTHLEERMK